MADKTKKSASKGKAPAAQDAKKAVKKADKVSDKATAQAQTSKTEKEKKKKKRFDGISRFFRELKPEIKKVIWPTPHAVWKNVGVVVVMVAVVGLFVFGLDEAFTNLLHQFMNVAV
ncbi:MAG: preprotein translocase subunit SecE [Oscillospiraceae bacterium]|nr:preprotein translocase subunit SecE [Oscillospiraceae bacterium]